MLHSIFPINDPIPLNKPGEKIQNLALTDSFLFYIARINHSEFLSFFIIPIDNLVSFAPESKQVLKDLRVRSGEVEEIDAANKWLIIKQRNLQVWNIETGRMIHCIDIEQALYFKYSCGVVVVCNQSQEVLNIFIHFLRVHHVASLSVPNGSVPYHCEVIQGSLVLGMVKKEMIMINLTSFQITRIGTIRRFYEFQDFDEGFVLFNDGSGIFISNPQLKLQCGNIGRIFVNNAGKLLVYSKEKVAVLVLDPSGTVNEVKLDRRDKVQVLGFSNSSQTFFVGKKNGLISVFE
jgi:hypothetical protein